MLELNHDVFSRLMNVYSILMFFGWVVPSVSFSYSFSFKENKKFLNVLLFICGILTTLAYISIFIYRIYGYVLYGL